MSNLEIALRGALSKGDISDADFRRKVYETAAGALHRSLEAKVDASTEEIENQNRRLTDAIRKIEADLKSGDIPAAPSVEPVTSNVEAPPPVASPVAADSTRRDLRAELRLRNGLPENNADVPLVHTESHAAKSQVYVEPVLEKAEEPTAREPEPVKSKPKKPRGRYARFLAGAIAVSLLGIGLLWALDTGLFQSAEERDTSVPNPATVLESESFEARDPGTANAPATLETRTTQTGGWVTMFSPSNPTALALIGGATANVESDPFGDYARLATPAQSAEVQIGIPRNMLAQGIGTILQISLRARSDEGMPTQMSVTCDLQELGDCGRRRFNVGQAENEFIFQIDLTEAQSAPDSAHLSIDTDVQGGGRAIKLLEARVRVADGA